MFCNFFYCFAIATTVIADPPPTPVHALEVAAEPFEAPQTPLQSDAEAKALANSSQLDDNIANAETMVAENAAAPPMDDAALGAGATDPLAENAPDPPGSPDVVKPPMQEPESVDMDEDADAKHQDFIDNAETLTMPGLNDALNAVLGVEPL
jgi:hypothetical protein